MSILYYIYNLVLKDIDQVLTLEQQTASKKAVEKHTTDHVAALTKIPTKDG